MAEAEDGELWGRKELAYMDLDPVTGADIWILLLEGNFRTPLFPDGEELPMIR